jgi:hypothetical protein
MLKRLCLSIDVDRARLALCDALASNALSRSERFNVVNGGGTLGGWQVKQLSSRTDSDTRRL